MDPDRQRIQDDLRGLIDGEVRCDDVFLQMYASDASIYEIEPRAVVRPRHTSDVVACVQYAREHGLPVHPRGAGTGVAGGCLGRGIVLDFSHSMRRIIRTDAESVRVQPGVILANLNKQLRPSGRIFGPDPAGADVRTMGSVAAVNRAGSHWPKYGAARDRVEALQVVLADGSVQEFRRHRLDDDATHPTAVRRQQIVRQTVDLIQKYEPSIRAAQPRSRVQASGYAMHDVWDGVELDLAKLLTGSEGTLGIITEMTLRTDAVPPAVGVALLFFDRFDKATAAVRELTRFDLAACDLIDRRLLMLARESDVRYDVLLPPAAEAMLLVEVQDTETAVVRDRLKQLSQFLVRRKRLAFDYRVAVDPQDVDLYWQLGQRVLPSLYRLTGSHRPLPFVEDIAVPPLELGAFLTATQAILRRFEVTASLYAHACQGQLHLRPFLDLANEDHVALMQPLARELYELALQHGGTISGEHGNGLSRSWYLRTQFAELYVAMRELKRVFDPDEILNPGKITAADPGQLTRNLRPVTTPPQKDLSTAPLASDTNNGVAVETTSSSDDVNDLPDIPPQTLPLLLDWDTEALALAARSCNGCGDCRSQAPGLRMCPIFRLSPAEESSPRAKANLMRGLFTREVSPDALATDERKAVADLCVNCHQCRDECPANVDIPKLMIEFKAQYVATNGLPFSDWLLSRLDLLAPWAASFRSLTLLALGSRRFRWILERTIGLAQGRKLPRIASQSFLHLARRRRLTRPSKTTGAKVLYFTDIYANWFDVQLAEAVVHVLQHNGISVFVPTQQRLCGMSLIAMGAIDKAKRIAERNIRLLADAVRQGYTIVTSEPSATLCLTREYPNLFGVKEDVQLVADNTRDVCHYLWRMHQQGQLELDFKPVHSAVGYHLPCHARALGNGAPAAYLLQLIPGLSVHTLDRGCSGMAGTYGLKKENYRNSLRAGWPLISAIREPKLLIGSTECSTCKMQMEQGTDKATIHPLKLLALAYGLMPEIAGKLTEKSEERFIT